MGDKLSKEDVLVMGRYIPLMLEDLRELHHSHYTRFKVKWDKFNKKGAMGYEIVKLYMQIREQLPEDRVIKYP